MTVRGLLFVLAALASAPAAAQQTVMVGVRANMEATLHLPDGPGPFPAVLVLHTSLGPTEADRQYCARLAREGFVCLAPAFLRAHGIRPDMRLAPFTSERETILADLRHIVDELGRHPKVGHRPVGAVGFSNGGFFSVLLAAEARVKAGVAYSGALQGVGQPRPQNPFLQSFGRGSSPVLLLAAENDTTLGTAPVRRLEEIIRAAGARHELAFYADAEHGFDRNNLRPGNAAAAADAWARTLAFLRQHAL